MEYSPVSSTGNATNQEVETKIIKKKSKLQTYLPVLVPCLLAILILGILAGVWHTQLRNCKKHCDSLDCIMTSGEILKMTNLKADPCTDFHEFACGRFNSSALMKPESDVLTTYSELLEENLLKMYKLLTDNTCQLKGENSSAVSKVKLLFSSCMKTGEIEKLGGKPLIEFIATMGGWPLLEGNLWNESDWVLTDALVAANKLGIFPFFKYDVLPNFFNSSELEIKFLDVDLSYSNKNVYNRSGNEESLYKKTLIEYITAVSKLLGSDQNITKEAEDIWNLEQIMGKETFASYALTQGKQIAQINRTTIGAANNLLGDWINLEETLSKVFRQDMHSSEKIMIASDQYLQRVGELIGKTEKRTQANYVLWITIKKFIPSLSDSFRSAEYSFRKISTGQDAAKPRWKICIIRCIDTLGFALSGLFIEQYFVETAKNQVEEIFDMIKVAFRKSLSSVNWLDEETKKEALEKLNKLKKRIGYPDFIKDAQLLDGYYKDLSVGPGYFKNAIDIAYFEVLKMTLKYGNPRNKQEWIIPPIDFNAYYDRTTNEMVLLAGLLQKPLFSEIFPKSFNFGRVGFIIGHEIIHGFDSLGRLFNSDGNLVNWWSMKAELEFNKKSECFVKQYSSFSIFGHNTSGLRTLSEDIADNGGLSLAYLAYKNWLKTNSDLLLPGLDLTNEQQFFLAFGQYFCAYYRKEKAIELLETDSHSNNKIRVIGTIQNSEQFAEAFKCPKKSVMNPSNKCTLW